MNEPGPHEAGEHVNRLRCPSGCLTMAVSLHAPVALIQGPGGDTGVLCQAASPARTSHQSTP
eukprot:326051-Prorocentrum_lima.AAC.1